MIENAASSFTDSEISGILSLRKLGWTSNGIQFYILQCSWKIVLAKFCACFRYGSLLDSNTVFFKLFFVSQ